MSAVVLLGGRGLPARTCRTVCASALAAARQADLRIDRIEPHQHLARLHQLRVVGEHRDDRARNLRRNHHLVAVDVGIVGALALRQHQQPVKRPQHADEDEDRRDEQQNPAPFAVADLARGAGLARLRCLRSWCCLPSFHSRRRARASARCPPTRRPHRAAAGRPAARSSDRLRSVPSADR